MAKTDPTKPPVLHLAKITGLLLAHRIQSLKYQGDPEKLRQAYIDAQRHCLLFGWWSIFCFFLINSASLLLNAFNWHQYKKRYSQYLYTQGMPQNPIR